MPNVLVLSCSILFCLIVPSINFNCIHHYMTLADVPVEALSYQGMRVKRQVDIFQPLNIHTYMDDFNVSVSKNVLSNIDAALQKMVKYFQETLQVSRVIMENLVGHESCSNPPNLSPTFTINHYDSIKTYNELSEAVKQKFTPFLLERQNCAQKWKSGVNKEKCSRLRSGPEFCSTKLTDYIIPDKYLNKLEVYDYNDIQPRKVIESGQGIPNANFILFVISRTSSWCAENGVQAYGSYCRLDSDSRPVAGLLNMCPSKFSKKLFKPRYYFNVIMHEIIHILGFSHHLYSKFKTCTSGYDCTIPKKIVHRDANDIQRLVFPELVRSMQIHFNCSEAEFGAPLEQYKGESSILNENKYTSHWHPTLMYSSIMTPSLSEEGNKAIKTPMMMRPPRTKKVWLTTSVNLLLFSINTGIIEDLHPDEQSDEEVVADSLQLQQKRQISAKDAVSLIFDFVKSFGGVFEHILMISNTCVCKFRLHQQESYAVIDNITLSLLYSTGWYKVNFEKAQNFMFGKGQGCSFGYEDKCEVSDYDCFSRIDATKCDKLDLTIGKCENVVSFRPCINKTYKKETCLENIERNQTFSIHSAVNEQSCVSLQDGNNSEEPSCIVANCSAVNNVDVLRNSSNISCDHKEKSLDGRRSICPNDKSLAISVCLYFPDSSATLYQIDSHKFTNFRVHTIEEALAESMNVSINSFVNITLSTLNGVQLDFCVCLPSNSSSKELGLFIKKVQESYHSTYMDVFKRNKQISVLTKDILLKPEIAVSSSGYERLNRQPIVSVLFVFFVMTTFITSVL